MKCTLHHVRSPAAANRMRLAICAPYLITVERALCFVDRAHAEDIICLMAAIQSACSATRSCPGEKILQSPPRCCCAGRPKRPAPHRQQQVATKATGILEAIPTQELQEQQYVWQGDDEFTNLNDRYARHFMAIQQTWTMGLCYHLSESYLSAKSAGYPEIRVLAFRRALKKSWAAWASFSAL